MTGEAATAPDQHGQRNLSSTSEALLSTPDALPGVFPRVAGSWVEAVQQNRAMAG